MNQIPEMNLSAIIRLHNLNKYKESIDEKVFICVQY